MLQDALEQSLKKHNLLGHSKGSHFIVAYSGGRDSTALLHALKTVKDTSYPDMHISAAYYWHPWRPLQEDLQMIHRNCQELNIRWIMITPDLTVPKTEAAAREDRYKKLAQLAKELHANAILTGHHRDDQIETILFRIFRGTGIEGLTGIPEVREIKTGESSSIEVIRPFLSVTRQDINDYVQAQSLHYTEDPTNLETRYKRNYIRHQVVPKIKGGFSGLDEALLKLAELTTGELEIIRNKMDELWDEIYDEPTHSLQLIQFNQLSLPFQRRIIRRFLEGKTTDTLGHKKTEEIIEFIAGKNRRKFVPSLFSLDKDRFLMVFRNRITIERRTPLDYAPLDLVQVPIEVCHRDLRLAIRIDELNFEERMTPIDLTQFNGNTIYVDLSKYMDKPLTLRTRQKGDRIKPLGMGEPIKLKKFLIKRGVSRFKRDNIPLLASGSEVLWAVGLGLNDNIRVVNRPTHRIIVTEQPQNKE